MADTTCECGHDMADHLSILYSTGDLPCALCPCTRYSKTRPPRPVSPHTPGGIRVVLPPAGDEPYETHYTDARPGCASCGASLDGAAPETASCDGCAPSVVADAGAGDAVAHYIARARAGRPSPSHGGKVLADEVARLTSALDAATRRAEAAERYLGTIADVVEAGTQGDGAMPPNAVDALHDLIDSHRAALAASRAGTTNQP